MRQQSSVHTDRQIRRVVTSTWNQMEFRLTHDTHLLRTCRSLRQVGAKFCISIIFYKYKIQTMVAFLPAVSVGLTLTAAFLLYPRLPQYSFQIRSVSPRWYQETGFRAKLGAKVQLKNDNHIDIDIHALSFDLYYPDLSGNIQLLGNVQDTRLREIHLLQQHEIFDASKRKAAETMAALVDDAAFASAETPLWHLGARKHFETYDSVLMAPIGGLSVMGNLAWDMIQNWGVVQVQSTGAVHLKASGQMPLTLNILCDNLLDAWTLEMRGMHCELDRLDIGWKDIPSAMDALRVKLLRPKNELTQAIEDQNLGAVGV